MGTALGLRTFWKGEVYREQQLALVLKDSHYMSRSCAQQEVHTLKDSQS